MRCPFCGEEEPRASASAMVAAAFLATAALAGCSGRAVGSDGSSGDATGADDGGGNDGGGDGGDDGGGDDGGGDDGGGDDGGGPSTGGGDAGSDTEDGWTDDWDDGCAFYAGCPPDGGGWGDIECDVWAQDCPDGEKCMPWANDGGTSWNATRCSPLDADPKAPGEPCVVEGSGVSGVDDCELGAMCWNVDRDTNQGRCISFCEGTPNMPVCEDPATECGIYNEGVLILCLQSCDPLLMDCRSDEVCATNSGGSFQCFPAMSEPAGHAEECQYYNACDVGLACIVPDYVPGCTSSYGCCSEYCDVNMPNTCRDAAQGAECIPFWETPADAPEGYEHVGVCGVPP